MPTSPTSPKGWPNSNNTSIGFSGRSLADGPHGSKGAITLTARSPRGSGCNGDSSSGDDEQPPIKRRREFSTNGSVFAAGMGAGAGSSDKRIGVGVGGLGNGSGGDFNVSRRSSVSSSSNGDDGDDVSIGSDLMGMVDELDNSS